MRNTPTCVGKTPTPGAPQRNTGKHPHVRGEDRLAYPHILSRKETPPRAWGRPGRPCPAYRSNGNTPTCVGKTSISPVSDDAGEKHPHVRGEDRLSPFTSRLVPETPPRAWGRPVSNCILNMLMETPPRAWGRLASSEVIRGPSGKHPHVRGEDTSGQRGQGPPRETPPRAWGRPRGSWARRPQSRNTPTCVGKTFRAEAFMGIMRKHPHVRGEDPVAVVVFDPQGNTPTCVGKTIDQTNTRYRREKHPHVRGEDIRTHVSICLPTETPPRAWGRH